MNFKLISITSAILGAICAILCQIPVIKGFSCVFLCFLAAGTLYVFLNSKGLIFLKDAKDAMIFGAGSGFISFLAFFAVFLPLAMLFGAIFKTYTYGIPYFFNLSGLWLLILILGMLASIGAATNAVGTMAVFYVYGLIKKEQKVEFNFGKNDKMGK